MERMFETVDLGFFLLALGRRDEATDVAAYLADNTAFTGNYNVWTPAGHAMCLQAHLVRTAGRADEAESLLDRLREQPFNARETQADVSQKIDTHEVELTKALAEKSTKWSVQKLARTLSSICYYLETSLASFPHAKWCSVEVLQEQMSDGLSKLRSRLVSR